MSLPGSPKRWTWKLPPTLTSQITENHPIVTKVGPRRLPKCILKLIKVDIWPSVCPLGAPPGPMITEMVPQVPKIQPEDLQNDNLRYKKTPISIANQPAAPCIQGGRRQGRSLKIRRTPRRGAAGRDGIATEKKPIGGFRGSPRLPAPHRDLIRRARKSLNSRTLKKASTSCKIASFLDPGGHPKSAKA